VFAFAINLIFNRPIVYLNFLAARIARPIIFLKMALFYYLIVGVHALFFYISPRRKRGLRASEGATDRDSAGYQS